ncbi:MAG TPA: hypothetical protein VGQ86_10155 [Candidatus Limnocylindria bacterium]|nr:hypothetical protein [Candidatus Limnocylindria bacterium]
MTEATDVTDTRTLTKGVTVVGVFREGAAAREAARMLEKTGFPPDRVGIVDDNVRNAREVAGSYSPQGAILGALVGALLVALIVVFGGEAVRENTASVALGAVVVLVAFTAIGWLAGRARLFKQGEYSDFETAVEVGDALVSVVCETEDGADQARALLERAGAIAVRREESTEAV